MTRDRLVAACGAQLLEPTGLGIVNAWDFFGCRWPGPELARRSSPELRSVLDAKLYVGPVAQERDRIFQIKVQARAMQEGTKNP